MLKPAPHPHPSAAATAGVSAGVSRLYLRLQLSRQQGTVLAAASGGCVMLWVRVVGSAGGSGQGCSPVPG